MWYGWEIWEGVRGEVRLVGDEGWWSVFMRSEEKL